MHSIMGGMYPGPGITLGPPWSSPISRPATSPDALACRCRPRIPGSMTPCNMDVHQLSLAHLGMSDAGPVPLIEAAAGAGFRAVGLPLRSGALKPLKFEIVGNPPLIREIKAACQACGVKSSMLSRWCLGTSLTNLICGERSRPQPSSGRPVCPVLGRNGTRRTDPAEGRHAERLARVAEIAADFGLRIGVEFMMFRVIRTLGDAVRVVEGQGSRMSLSSSTPCTLDARGERRPTLPHFSRN